MDAVLDGRSRFFTWNCSGLSQEVLAEVLTWAADVGASCFALQETHWGFTADWRSDGWFFIHSAAGKPKTGGVLMAIRADLVTANSVRWAELVPGRLLHVRCLHGKQMMDFLTLYQQVKIRGDAAATKENLTQRDKTWKQLEKTLSAIPWRSYIVLAGDFNTSFSFSAPLIGKSVVNHEGLDAYKRESERVSTMLKAKGLVALNTFGKRRMTYVHPSGSSFIDFVMVRRPVADLASRRAWAIRSPMAGWRTVGHRPVLASLCLDWRPWQRQKPAGTTQQPLGLSDGNKDLSALKQSMVVAGESRPEGSVFQAPAVSRPTGLVRENWSARRAFLSIRPSTLRLVFEKLRLFARHQQVQRRMRAAARRAKRA